MEDHMASSETTGTGSSSVAMATDSMGTDPGLRVLCNRVKVLEQKAGSTIQSDSYLRNRIRELERSERSLLLQLYQLASASHLPSMQHSQRLDQRLHTLREEVRTMTQEKERGEQVWRERLQRCQKQLKAKEDEMSRQSQYFENFKTQLQHKLSLARDREQSLQNRIYTLEKQLLDMTVSAATGMAAIGAVRITAGTVTHWAEQERLTSMRGEGEGEEEKKEERRKQWQPSVGPEREGGREGDEGKTGKAIEGARNKDTKQSSNEARLQGFILSLQEDLRVLLEREEDGVTERRGLVEQLQEAQENGHFLGCKVEEVKAEVHQLKLSESSLMEEVEELREENHRLRQILREAANQTPSQSCVVPKSRCPSPGTSSPSCGPANTQSYTTAMRRSSVESSGEVHPALDGGADPSHSSADLLVHHQDAAESNTEDRSSSAKSDPLNLFAHRGSAHNLSFQSLTLTAETIDEFKLGNWCSRGLLNLEESPSEESDALREAYRSLGLGEDLEALREQRDRLEDALQQTQEQLEVLAQENTQLKSQLRKQAEDLEAELGSSGEKIGTPSACDGAEHLQSSAAHNNTILTLAQDDLVQALNQENRALAERIQELLAHIELREEEIKTEQTQLREHISRLEEGRAGLEQQNQEQGCLITELTRKTEDDLNTIMDLQQKLGESREQSSMEECVDVLVQSVLKGEGERQSMSSQQSDDLATASAPGSQHNNHCDLLQNSPQNTLKVSSLTEQVEHLTKTVQSLQTEQDELRGNISSLREQQREVALSVQTQTEEKQQLTRTVWGLKEEKDRISQCLAGLRQDREQLTRTVCGLKDERDHFIRSMSGLKEEKEQLTKSIFGLEREKEALMESLSSGKEERDRIMRSLQSLQTESDQLSQTVLNLKQERDELTIFIKCLKEQRDQEQSSYTLQDDRDKLVKSVSSLREEKERIEHSITCLKQEEKQIVLVIRGLREERNILQSALPSQTQTEERNQRLDLLNPDSAGATKKTETLFVTGDYAAQWCQTNNYKGNSIQEQSDLMREIEALGAQLKRSHEELDKSHIETKTLHGELCHSEARREEAERKAAQAAEKVMTLTDAANQMEETRRENESLHTQVKELQSKVTGLVRERTDALSLKTQVEEQYNILTAQLKAKTVALEELNSEYIALKRGQGSKDDMSTALVSLRARYNDIRAKYDVLLKKKSQTDLDIAPLKAKLSCLVVKCQERNSSLVQMVKAMRRQGGVDPALAQQVEQLLSDAALRDYAAAFAPGSIAKTGDHSAGFTPRFISNFQDFTSGFLPDQTCPAAATPANDCNGLTPDSGFKRGGLKSEKHISLSSDDSWASLHDCRTEVTPAATGALKKNANSPVPTSPVRENASVQAPSESLTTAQLSPSASGPIHETSAPKKFGFPHPDMRGKSTPDPSSSAGSPPSHPPPSSSTRLSPSRRLSSPEKIISLHEQLQKTLMSSYQAPVSRGRGQEPRKSLSFSACADFNPASQTNKQSLGFNVPHANSLPVTTASSQAKHTPVVTTKPAATNKSATLFNAVASRSANVTFSPNIFSHHHFKADVSVTTATALSSSSNRNFAAMTPEEAKSTSNCGANNVAESPKPIKKVTATPNVSDAIHTAATPLTPRTTTFDSNVLACSDTNPKTTASVMTAPGKSTAPKLNMFNGAAPAYDGLVIPASWTQSAHCSPERSNTSARKSTGAPDKTARPRPEAPAEVRSVEVIKTVGQSSLMIGWERPPLDELGCSNGTFVYGYRVFIDGDFHKSVMSSACTKCIVENVDLSVPVHISVQTLGSNGLSSNSVHAMYRTSVRTDQH